MSKKGYVLFVSFVAGCNVENLCHTMSMVIVIVNNNGFCLGYPCDAEHSRTHT